MRVGRRYDAGKPGLPPLVETGARSRAWHRHDLCRPLHSYRDRPTATAGAQPTGDEATAIPFLKRFTSPIPSTVKICDRYPEHLAR